MKTPFAAPHISDHTITAICWTLIHSLWIGLAVALLTGLVIITTRRSAAALRYRLLCSILVLFVASACITFYLEIKTGAPARFPQHPIVMPAASIQTFALSPTPPTHTTLPDTVVNFLNRYIDLIFIAWLLIFSLKSMKMISGLAYLHRIRNYKIHEVADEFKDKIELFSRQIGIGRTVRLVQSELIKVPVAVGWLKPVVLLPVGVMLQLSPGQLESILWHELAHIRRRDYLVNILQGLVEVVFFFNPGLLWLSSLIRAEREACCDDMVLSRMNRKANYLEALLAFGYEGSGRTTLAMSIGSGNQLRDRLKRMVSQENRRLSAVEKIVLAASLIVLSAFTGLPKTTHQAVTRLVHVMVKKAGSSSAAKPAMVAVPATPQPLPPVKKQAIGDSVTRKPDTAMLFTSILFKNSDEDVGNNEISAKDNHGNSYHFTVADDRLVALDINNTKVAGGHLNEYQYLVSRIYHTIAGKRRASREDIAAAKANMLIERQREAGKWQKYSGDMLKADSSFVRYNKRPQAFVTPKKDLWYGAEDRYAKSADMVKRLQNDSVNYSDDLTRAQNVIADLVKEKVVASPADVKSFGLTETELVVNDQQQPQALQQHLKAKYGIRQNYGLYYGPVKMTGTGVFIGNDEERKQQYSFQQKQLKLEQQQSNAMYDSRRDDMKSYARQHLYQSRIPLSPIIANVINDLVSEKVLSDKSDLSSFYLTNTSLTVNGVKQSEGIHEKLKTKYLKDQAYPMKKNVVNNPDFGLHYDKDGDMGLGITTSPFSPSN